MNPEINLSVPNFKAAFKTYSDVVEAMSEMDLLLSPVGIQVSGTSDSISIFDDRINVWYLIKKITYDYTIEII